MSDYLPQVHQDFRTSHPEVASASDRLGAAVGAAGPPDSRTQSLVKLGIAMSALAECSVRSNVRRALDAGATDEEVRHVALLAITAAGFPTGIAGLGWIDEVLTAR